MPKQKMYQNAAEKQAAYRARHAHKKPPRIDDLAALARTLHGAVQDAAGAGDPLATQIAGQRADDTLRGLIALLRQRADSPSKSGTV